MMSLSSPSSRAYHTSQLDSIIHHVIQLIKLSLQPHIKHSLILVDERRARRWQDLRALLQIIDVVNTKQRQPCIRFGVVLRTTLA